MHRLIAVSTLVNLIYQSPIYLSLVFHNTVYNIVDGQTKYLIFGVISRVLHFKFTPIVRKFGVVLSNMRFFNITFTLLCFIQDHCQSIQAPSGSYLNFSTNGTVTMATVHCNAGYTLNGNQMMTCQANGTWDKSPGNCSMLNTIRT